MDYVKRFGTGLLLSVAFVLGAGIAFGDLFFLESGSWMLHVYSLLSLLSLSAGALLLAFGRLHRVVLFGSVVHLLVTIVAALLNAAVALLGIAVLIDLGLMELARAGRKAKQITP